MSLFRDVFSYRAFILSSIKNEFITTFSRSKLGGFWMIVHPLAQVAIYALILSNVLAAKLPGIDGVYSYSLYLMAGMLAYNLFSELITRFIPIFITNANLLKKIMFPKITLPVIVVGICSVNNLLLLIAVLLVFTVLGVKLSVNLLWLLPLVFVTAVFASGIGLILAVLNVFIRDISQITPILLQMIFWFTPIVYPVEILSSELRALVEYNPLYVLVTEYHQVLVYEKAVNIIQVAKVFFAGVGLLLIGLFMFRRSAPEMVDVL